VSQPTLVSERRIEGLRRYHASRPEKTRQKLNEAFDRMVAGTTVVLDPKKFKLTKADLAREAEVNIHTLLKKERDGKFRFQSVLSRLESHQRKSPAGHNNGDEKDQKIMELRAIVSELKTDKLKLAHQLDQTALQLLEANQKMEELQQDNHEQLQELLSLRNRVVTHVLRSDPKRKR
jgi:hypothetical protein